MSFPSLIGHPNWNKWNWKIIKKTHDTLLYLGLVTECKISRVCLLIWWVQLRRSHLDHTIIFMDILFHSSKEILKSCDHKHVDQNNNTITHPQDIFGVSRPKTTIQLWHKSRLIISYKTFNTLVKSFSRKNTMPLVSISTKMSKYQPSSFYEDKHN